MNVFYGTSGNEKSRVQTDATTSSRQNWRSSFLLASYFITSLGVHVKIAVAIFGKRVSPRFDFAPRLLIADLVDSTREPPMNLDMTAWSPDERPDKLAKLGIDVLICGGIDRLSIERCRELGVDVFPWVSGAADDVIPSFLNGDLTAGAMLGRGGRCRGRWRFGRGRNPESCFGGSKGIGPRQ